MISVMIRSPEEMAQAEDKSRSIDVMTNRTDQRTLKVNARDQILGFVTPLTR